MSQNIARIGSNNPPSPIEFGENLIREINIWLTNHPAIQTEEDAREAKPYLDRAKAAMEEIEAERDKRVRPLNEEVAAINLQYKAVHNTDAKKPGLFDKIINELKARMQVFMIHESERRAREAEQARKIQEEAERAAREAEDREREIMANASLGEVVDVADAVRDADKAFSEFEHASRFADRAERESKVRIGGGFDRAATLRTVETLHLISYGKALKAIGPHDKIRDAILSAAREYRKVHGHLPEGVTATTEQSL